MSSPVRHLLKFNLNINFPVHTDFERNRFWISSKLVIHDQTIFKVDYIDFSDSSFCAFDILRMAVRKSYSRLFWKWLLKMFVADAKLVKDSECDRKRQIGRRQRYVMSNDHVFFVIINSCQNENAHTTGLSGSVLGTKSTFKRIFPPF